MDIINTEEFREWLRKNTKLSEGSILLYARTINNFLKLYNATVTIENINDFVSKSFRESHSYYTRFAFKHFLKYFGKPNMYKKIVELKQSPSKKIGKYLPEKMILNIISKIDDELFRAMATLQFATGARAREIITLKEENIDVDYKQDVIRIKIDGKGGKQRMTFLSKQYKKIIEKYSTGKAGFLFLIDEANFIPTEDLERLIHNQRTYYYNALNRSIKKLGIDKFGTHDFRRNVAEMLKRNKVPIYTAQKVLGHSDIRTTLLYFNESPEDIEETIIDHQTKEAE